jgi:cytochrome c biogenesis protein CcmG, thiol:disulfide interchange protein DsbE
MPRWSALSPVVLFLALAVGLFFGLGTDTRTVPSVLIGKPAPVMDMMPIEGLATKGFSAADFKNGRVTLVNIFGSWCAPCRLEHPLLMELSKRDDLQIFGINTKDKPADVFAFLAELGQPYDAIGEDRSGRIAIEWGGYGVPETFIIDAQGIIRFKRVGPLTPESFKDVKAEIEKAKNPL